jgi:hypothetical protein
MALLKIEGKWTPVPLRSQVHGAHAADVDVMMPLLEETRTQLKTWPMHVLIADRGYISAAHARRMRREWNMALLLHPKCSMHAPQDTDTKGCPLCPWGKPLVWQEYDPSDEQLVYRGNPRECSLCALAGTCAKQFDIDAGANEAYWGMIPYHSRLARKLLRQFRPRVEPQFNTGKNLHRLKDFFLNSRELAETLCIMSDLVETLSMMAKERPQRGRETKKALHRDIFAPEIWE